MRRPFRFFRTQEPLRSRMGSLLAAGLLCGGVLVGVLASAPSAGADGVGVGHLPGQCPPPSAASLAPASSDHVFFSFAYFDQVQLVATAPLSTNPNSGCGPVTYQVFGWSGSSAVTPISSTMSVGSDGTLLFTLPSVPGGYPYNFYLTASGITGASAPSNVVTLMLPSLTALSTPQEALALLEAGNTLYFNWPGFGLAPVTTPLGPTGPWQDANGQSLPAGTGLLLPAAPPAG